jgi:hypothetical protein
MRSSRAHVFGSFLLLSHVVSRSVQTKKIKTIKQEPEMAWIRTIPMEEADDELRRLMEGHRALDYVVQLTRDATRLTPQDHDKLRAVGFDDLAILQITLIASWFNYINRVADVLGVGRGKKEDWYPHG